MKQFKRLSPQTCVVKESGFTIIEMMIAMTILAFISVGVYEMTHRTFEMREKLEADGDFYNTVRLALGQFERDYLMLYTPQLAALPTSISQLVLTAENTRGAVPDPRNRQEEPFDPGRATEFWGQFINRAGIRPSRLQGETQKISFITSNHVRLYKDSHEADFAKIVYTLEEDTLSKDDATRKGKVLVRYEDPNAFQDDGRRSDTNARYRILSRVKDLKLEFLDGRNDRWFPRWDTDNPETKNQFPALVKLRIEVIPPPPIPAEATFVVEQVYKPELAL